MKQDRDDLDDLSANALGGTKKSRIINWLCLQEQWTSTLRNLAIIIGVIVALIGVSATLNSVDVALKKLNQDGLFFRKSVSIAALSSTREENVIRAFTRLKTARVYCEQHRDKKEHVLQEIYQQNDTTKNTNFLIDDINLVSEKFSHVFQLYRIGDREIILRAIYLKIKEFSKIIEKLSSLIGPVESEFKRIDDEYLNYMLREIREQIDWKDEEKGRKF